jgi:two-component system sensor histidine kinase KdpD
VSSQISRYAGAVLVVAACTAVALPMHHHFELSNLTMVYLLGVVVAAVAFGRGPAIAASVLGVAVFDFGFVPPRFTFHVDDAQYLVSFAVMLIVALVTSTLTARLREQLAEARASERRISALYGLSRELASRSSAAELLDMAVARIASVLAARVAVLQPTGAAGLALSAGDAAVVGDAAQRDAAQRALENGQISGLEQWNDAPHVVHIPLEAGVRIHGVMSARPVEGGWDPERLQLLRTLASQTALALERCRLAEESLAARAQAETERTRSALLSSVSHDLRTPLAAITGAATSLRDGADRMNEATRRELAETIADEAVRLNHWIGNILEMTRLESGTIAMRREWHSLEEVVGAALVRLESVLGDRPVNVRLAGDLPLVSIDDVRFEQVVWNLVENAHKYAPAGTAIDVSAELDGGGLRFEVADRGPGLAAGEEARVFEKFHRGSGATAQPGAGLGLAICRGIVLAHGGTIAALAREGGGTRFVVRLPLTGTPPSIEREPEDDSPAPSRP